MWKTTSVVVEIPEAPAAGTVETTVGGVTSGRVEKDQA
jgi:hypothetical protein